MRIIIETDDSPTAATPIVTTATTATGAATAATVHNGGAAPSNAAPTRAMAIGSDAIDAGHAEFGGQSTDLNDGGAAAIA